MTQQRRAIAATIISGSASTAASTASRVSDFPYLNGNDCLRRVYREEGWRALFAGLGPRVAWISLGGAMFFGAYEYVKKELAALPKSLVVPVK